MLSIAFMGFVGHAATGDALDKWSSHQHLPTLYLLGRTAGGDGQNGTPFTLHPRLVVGASTLRRMFDETTHAKQRRRGTEPQKNRLHWMERAKNRTSEG